MKIMIGDQEITVEYLFQLERVIKELPNNDKVALFQHYQKNPEQLEPLIEDNMDFMKLAEHPELKEALIQLVLHNKEVFEHVVTNGFDLGNLAKVFPDDKVALFQRYQENPEKLEPLINSNFSFMELAKYPELKEALIQLVRHNPKILDRVVTNGFDLCNLAKVFPDDKAALFQRYQENPEKLEPLINSNFSFMELAEHPELKETLIDLVLHNPKIFDRVVEYGLDLDCLARVFPDDKATLFQRYQGNPEQLEPLINGNFTFMTLAEHPELKEALIQLVRRNPKIFKRVVTNGFDLDRLAQAFPDHKVFQKGSIDAVIAALKSEPAIRQAAKIMHQSVYGTIIKNGCFAKLPDDVNKKIAASTRDPDTHDKEEAHEIARTNYSPPI